MKNKIRWEAFSLVPQNELAAITGAPYSSLSKWKVSRPQRIRLLEYGAYLNLFNSGQKEQMIANPKLTLKNVIKELSGSGDFTLTTITTLTGESDRTLQSWWNTQGEKRKMCLSILIGLFSLLATAKKPKFGIYWHVTDTERLESERVKITDAQALSIKEKVFELWLVAGGEQE